MTEVELLTMFQEVAIVDGVTVVKFGFARYGSVYLDLGSHPKLLRWLVLGFDLRCSTCSMVVSTTMTTYPIN